LGGQSLRKYLIGFISGCIVAGSFSVVQAASPQGKIIQIFNNIGGVFVEENEIPSDEIFIYNDRTYVPLRKVTELFNSRIDWIADKNIIRISKPIIINNQELLLPPDVKIDGMLITSEGMEQHLPAYILIKGKSKITIGISGYVFNEYIDPTDQDPFSFLKHLIIK
jgi:hypothetical protein